MTAKEYIEEQLRAGVSLTDILNTIADEATLIDEAAKAEKEKQEKAAQIVKLLNEFGKKYYNAEGKLTVQDLFDIYEKPEPKPAPKPLVTDEELAKLFVKVGDALD